RTTSYPTGIYVCVFVRRFGLTARIHIDAPYFSFLLVFHDRGKISQGFSRTFCLARCRISLKELRNRVFFCGLGLFRTEGRPCERTHDHVLFFRLLFESENIFWTSSNAAVLTLTAVTFASECFERCRRRNRCRRRDRHRDIALGDNSCPFSPLQPRSPYMLPLRRFTFFPSCPRSSLSLCGNIPFSFDLGIHLRKLDIYLQKLDIYLFLHNKR
ncbi:hypothetical protein IGI04_028320, partial [Brassica rapa subsp. trilocularis]